MSIHGEPSSPFGPDYQWGNIPPSAEKAEAGYRRPVRELFISNYDVGPDERPVVPEVVRRGIEYELDGPIATVWDTLQLGELEGNPRFEGEYGQLDTYDPRRGPREYPNHRVFLMDYHVPQEVESFPIPEGAAAVERLGYYGCVDPVNGYDVGAQYAGDEEMQKSTIGKKMVSDRSFAQIAFGLKKPGANDVSGKGYMAYIFDCTDPGTITCVYGIANPEFINKTTGREDTTRPGYFSMVWATSDAGHPCSPSQLAEKAEQEFSQFRIAREASPTRALTVSGIGIIVIN